MIFITGTPLAHCASHAMQPVQVARRSLYRFVIVEVNEAFAAQYIACERDLGLDREITNVNGSGIGLGHPVGCTGARLIVAMIHALKKRNKTLGLATLCGGGGASMA